MALRRRAELWTLAALLIYPTARILVHLANVALGLAGSASLRTLTSHYVIAFVICALPALALIPGSAFASNLLRFGGLLAAIMSVVAFFSIVNNVGNPALSAIVRRSVIDLVNYVLPAIPVAYAASLFRASPTRATSV